VSESRIDQQPIYEKGINLKEREARKLADHSNRIHRTIRQKTHRNPIHVLLVVYPINRTMCVNAKCS
jgi:hypothetical protein